MPEKGPDSPARVKDWLLDGLVALAALAAIIIAGDYLTKTYLQTEDVALTTEIAGWEQYSQEGHAFGPDNAAVTIVYFGDYECPACRALEEDLNSVRERFPSEVRVVYRHWPLERHSFAYDAARGAECAGQQGRFMEYHTALYTSTLWQGGGLQGHMDLAANAGVQDLATFQYCMSSGLPDQRIEADVQAARRLGGTGTPTVLVGDRLITAAWDSVRLGSVVTEVLLERSSR